MTDVKDGGKSLVGRDDIRHNYYDYCNEFKELFYRISRTSKASKNEYGKLWERISLINPWNFYNLSADKINLIHDELKSAGAYDGTLKKMKTVFDGDDNGVGLVEYVAKINGETKPCEPVPVGVHGEDVDLAALDVEVLGDGVVAEEDIVEKYWTYGDATEHNKLRKSHKDENQKEVFESMDYYDMNLHVVTKEGNDGKFVNIPIEHGKGKDKMVFMLENGFVSDNEAVFEKVFVDYIPLDV